MARQNQFTTPKVMAENNNLAAILKAPGVIEFHRSLLPHEIRPDLVRK
jgi:hypothetical protein